MIRDDFFTCLLMGMDPEERQKFNQNVLAMIPVKTMVKMWKAVEKEERRDKS